MSTATARPDPSLALSTDCLACRQTVGHDTAEGILYDVCERCGNVVAVPVRRAEPTIIRSAEELAAFARELGRELVGVGA